MTPLLPDTDVGGVNNKIRLFLRLSFIEILVKETQYSHQSPVPDLIILLLFVVLHIFSGTVIGTGTSILAPLPYP